MLERSSLRASGLSSKVEQVLECEQMELRRRLSGMQRAGDARQKAAALSGLAIESAKEPQQE